MLFAQICNIELSRGIPRLCCHHVKEQWCQPIEKKNNLIYIYIDRCICKKYAVWSCEAENKQQRSHVSTQIWIQGCPQDAAKVSIVFSCPLHPPADIWRQSSTNVGTRLKEKKKGKAAYKTASSGRLWTWPGMPVVQMLASWTAPLMCPLSAAFR